MDILALEVACLDFVYAIWFLRVELCQPEVALGCLQAIVSFNRFYNGDVETVALLALTQLTDLAE